MTVTPKVALVALCAVALSITAAPGIAKTKPSSRAKNRITVTTSRVERSLAGVRLGTKANTLFKLFGQPNEIQLGSGNAASGTEAGGAFGEGASPLGATAFPTTGQVAGPPMPSVGLTMPGAPAIAGMPSMALPMPGATSGAFPGAAEGAGTDSSAAGPTVTYIYHNFRKHKGLEMMIQMDEDGRVVQIIGTSLKAVPGVVTSRGIGFGSSYRAVLNRYSWPESQSPSGTYLQASYQERAHVAFQFLQTKVVRIVVAEVE